ncbi:MAG: lysophospholipid acyltransferase family protein [Blastocatellia bacterium]
MSNQIDKVYKRSPLTGYSIKERFLIRTADMAFYLLIRIIGSTIRFETNGWDNVEKIESGGKNPIYALWHDRIFLGTYFLRNRGILVITSQSFDGEYIARFLTRFGFGSIRGSSTRGGVGALVEAIRQMKQGRSVAITVDGPKGPRYAAKDGAIILAKKTGNPVVPFIVETRNFWSLGSWDKLQIPRPFTRAEFIVGKPISVAPDATEIELESAKAELQQSLDELVSRAGHF